MVTVQVRYLNGDEALFHKCRTIDDARVKCASLHERLAPEVIFLSRGEHNMLHKLSEEPPILPVNAIFLVADVYTEELLRNAVLLHAQCEDRLGVVRAMGYCATDNDAQFLCARSLMLYLRTNVDCSSDVIELLCSFTTPNAINVEDELLWTPLDMACFQNADNEVIRILLGAKSDVRHVDQRGRTALLRSTYQGKQDLVKLLLTYDVGHDGRRAVNIADRTGCTPLCLASFQGYTHIARSLLQHKAQVNHAGNSAMTALHQASCSGHSEAVQLLLEYGADSSLLTRNGRPPLILAAMEGHVEVCRTLLKHGADVHFTIEGCNALGFAALKCNAKLCELLLENGANVNAVMRGRGTALIMASRREAGLAAVEVLLRAKADVTMCNTHGWEALCIAMINGNMEIAQKLREYGARCDAATKRASHREHEDFTAHRSS